MSVIKAKQRADSAERLAWIAGAIWALEDQGFEVTVYVREAIAQSCPIK